LICLCLIRLEVIRVFETLKRLWNEGILTLIMASNAVAKGWITAMQYEEITGEPYAA